MPSMLNSPKKTRLSVVRAPVGLAVVVLGLAVALAGCAAPKPLTREELVKHGKDYVADRRKESEGLPAQWTLERSLIYALQHNVDYRVTALEHAIATGNSRLASMDMLPGLVADAGYQHRSNTMASVSKSVNTGAVSLEPSTSSDRESWNAQMYLSWDLVDFGLAYLRSREYGQQALGAAENRRRVMQATVRDVVYAWWQAQAYQTLKPELDLMRNDVQQALQQSDEIVRQRLGNPMQAVEYRSALLLLLRRTDALSLQLDQSRDELSRLLNLPADSELHVTPATDHPEVAAQEAALPGIDSHYWQYAALVDRPEMRQVLYAEREAKASTAKRMLEAVPRLVFRFGAHYDSNSYLVNNRWNEGSAELSWNLIKLASIPGIRRDIRMQRDVAKMKAEAQATAVLSQVAIAGKAYDRNRSTWCLSKAMLDLNQRKSELLSAHSETESIDRLTLIRSRLDNLLLRTESSLQYAEYQRARITLLLSAGLADLPKLDDPATAEQVLHDWLNGGIAADTLAELRKVGSEFELPALPDDATLKASAVQLCPP